MQGRLFRMVPWLLAAVGWLSALLVYAHASLTAKWAGHWPAPGVPDPADTPFQVLGALATLVFFVAYATPAFLLAWAIANLVMTRRMSWARPGFVVGAASYAAWYAWAFLWDPASVVSWFLD